MPLRVLGCALLLIVVAAFKFPASKNEQDRERSATDAKWEYKAIRLDARQCSLEQEMVALLNTTGRQGWELVSYERLSSSVPKEAEGTLLIRNAATGPGRLTSPQTADSLQGRITMRLAEIEPLACRLLFKRQAHAGAAP